MNMRNLLSVGLLGGILLAGTAFAQQIQTNASVTTQGSTTFGYLPNGADLGVFMQTTVAPTCTTVSTNVQTCTSDGGTALADNDNFVRVTDLPGSFTDSPIPGTVSSLPNFACGPVIFSECITNMTILGGPASAQVQTAPNSAGRQLVGLVNTNVTIGDGGATAGMPDGFIAFTLDPTTGAATIDQFIDHSIDLGGGNFMVFQQRDATIGGVAIPNPIGGPLALVAFTALDVPDLSLPGGGLEPIPPTGMVSRLTLNQGTADGFGGLVIDETVNFPGSGPGSEFPFPFSFVAPGLNMHLPNFTTPFSVELSPFVFP